MEIREAAALRASAHGRCVLIGHKAPREENVNQWEIGFQNKAFDVCYLLSKTAAMIKNKKGKRAVFLQAAKLCLVMKEGDSSLNGASQLSSSHPSLFLSRGSNPGNHPLRPGARTQEAPPVQLHFLGSRPRFLDLSLSLLPLLGDTAPPG